MLKIIVILKIIKQGFEGDITSNDSVVMKAQLNWEYMTISKGENSLYEKLKADKNIDNPFEYIKFFGLRTHAKLKKPVTEIIYVHSKVK